MDKLTTEQMHEVNKCALHYGLGKQDFMSLLTRDLDEQESMRMAKEEEQERAMYSVNSTLFLTLSIKKTTLLHSFPFSFTFSFVVGLFVLAFTIQHYYLFFIYSFLYLIDYLLYRYAILIFILIFFLFYYSYRIISFLRQSLTYSPSLIP